jgi:hypothetical protein
VDSIYEYFLKQWLQSGDTDTSQLSLYTEHVDIIKQELLRYTTGDKKLAYFVEITGSTYYAFLKIIVEATVIHQCTVQLNKYPIFVETQRMTRE